MSIHPPIDRQHYSYDTEGNVAAYCSHCKQTYAFKVQDVEALTKWSNGEGLIQNILSDVSLNFRELLISGICGLCFDKIWMKDDERIF
jgi:hypothetical protein